jgi:hypothetical protein
MAATLTGFAPSGTQIVALTPKSRAPWATDWPWFPVDDAMTPLSRSAALSCEARLTPPRTLNAPVGRWFSCLTKTVAPTRRPSGAYSRSWLEDAARCRCPTLDDCPLFDEPARLPERPLVLR